MYVCLFGCLQESSKTNGSILMKFGSMTDNDIGKSPINFGHDRGHDPDPRSGKNDFSFKNITVW